MDMDDGRTIQEIMEDLERDCLEFQTKWEMFIANYNSKYNKDNGGCNG